MCRFLLAGELKLEVLFLKLERTADMCISLIERARPPATTHFGFATPPNSYRVALKLFESEDLETFFKADKTQYAHMAEHVSNPVSARQLAYAIGHHKTLFLLRMLVRAEYLSDHMSRVPGT